MSKILDAECLAGVVKVENLPVDAEILSQGTKQSTGVVVIEDKKATYLTSNASDIKDLITNLVTIVQQVVLITTALDAVTVSPGSAAAAITQLTLLKTQLDLTKDQLK